MIERILMAALAGLSLTGADLPRNSEGVPYEQIGRDWALMHLNEGCAATMANKGVFDLLMLRRDRVGKLRLIILIKGDWRRSPGEALWVTAMERPSTDSVLFGQRIFFTRGAWTGAGTYFLTEMPPELYDVLGRMLILSYTNGSTINNSFVVRDMPLMLRALGSCQPMQAQVR